MNKRIVLIAILLLGLMAAAATVMAREALLEGDQTASRGGAGMTADDMSTLRGLFGRAGRRAEGLDELFGLSAANQADDNANDNDDNANDNGDDNANDNGCLLYTSTARGRALELESRFAEADLVYGELERLGDARDEPRLQLAALIAQGKLRANVTPFYDPVAGRALMQRALALAEQLDDRPAEVRILWNLLNIDRFDVFNLENATQFGERALNLARELGLAEETASVSYTHLDVYKRQIPTCLPRSSMASPSALRSAPRSPRAPRRSPRRADSPAWP